MILDCRAPEAFGGGHIPGALNVGIGCAFPTWAGTVLPEGAKVLLVLEGPADLWEICARIRGAIHISGGELPDRIGVPRDRPVAVICGSGYRSSVVSSLLKRAGREEIFNVLGGMGAWKRAGLPTESSSNIREGGA